MANCINTCPEEEITSVSYWEEKREGEAACKVFYKMRRLIGWRILIFVCIPNHLYHYKVFTGGKKYEQKVCLHVQRR